ncbi:hypothetical protein HanIR_Chr05g0247941 [Helianthus annuus]|nr:hypothetical protein HanIR_Chr05g0247941 [Helianthus annuus]
MYRKIQKKKSNQIKITTQSTFPKYHVTTSRICTHPQTNVSTCCLLQTQLLNPQIKKNPNYKTLIDYTLISILHRSVKQAINFTPAAMADWGPVLVAVVLFVLLTPGLLFQLPGHNRVVEFGSMRTSGAAVIVHAVIYFAVITIFLIAIGVHVYAG